jgi:hypothetical protein
MSTELPRLATHPAASAASAAYESAQSQHSEVKRKRLKAEKDLGIPEGLEGAKLIVHLTSQGIPLRKADEIANLRKEERRANHAAMELRGQMERVHEKAISELGQQVKTEVFDPAVKAAAQAVLNAVAAVVGVQKLEAEIRASGCDVERSPLGKGIGFEATASGYPPVLAQWVRDGVLSADDLKAAGFSI